MWTQTLISKAFAAASSSPLGELLDALVANIAETSTGVVLLSDFNLLSPEPVFQVSGSKMTFPEQMTISSLLKGLN